MSWAARRLRGRFGFAPAGAMILAALPIAALACAAASASEPSVSPVGADHIGPPVDDGGGQAAPDPRTGAVAQTNDGGPADPLDAGSSIRSDGGTSPRDLDGGAPRCPNGALVDPHYGFVRCLRPEEADGGAPVSDGGAPVSDGGDAAAGPPPAVEVGPVVLDGGEIKTLAKMLAKMDKPIGRCVADNGGLTGAAGSVKLTFLVRTSERAEGVEVVARKGVTVEAAVCVRKALKNKWVGTPTGDPVGVTVTFTLKPGTLEVPTKKGKGDKP